MYGSKSLCTAAVLLALLFGPASPGTAAQVLGSGVPQAQQGNLANEPFVYDYVRVAMRFENDGMGSVDVQARLHVQTALGLQRVGQLVFNYNAETERQEVSFVRVLKPDGRTIVAGPETAQDLSAPVSQAAPMYSDIRQKHVTVPGLSVGDTLEYEVRTTATRSLIAGQFWQMWDFDIDAPCLDEQVDLNVPRERTLKMKSPTDVSPSVREEGDRRTYHWQTSFLGKAAQSNINVASARFDPTQAPMGSPLSPPRRLMFSTFQSWADFGKWYRALADDRKTVTPELQRRADEIVRGAKSDLEKAQAIYGYVGRNIRYVSLSFGIGRYQPHSAAEVLANQYGDCKDKATLLEALLEAEGLHSSSALVNTVFDVDPDAPSPQQFDHMISFISIDGKDLWLDSTSGLAQFGYLIPRLRGKNAVVLDSPAAKLAKTVKMPPETSYKTNVDVTVKDTNIDASITVELRGDAEFLARSTALALPVDSLNSALETAIKSNVKVQGASVRIAKIGDLQETSKPFLAQLQFSLPMQAAASTSAPGGPSVDSSDLAFIQNSLASLLPEVSGDEAESRKPLSLGFPRDISFHFHFTVPSLGRDRPTHPFHLSKNFAEFETTLAQDAQTMAVDWHLRLLTPELPAERVAEYAAFRKEVVKSIIPFESSPATTAVSSNAVIGLTPQEIHRAGVAELNNKNYNKAREYFEAAVAANPKYESAWNNLGRSYLNLGLLDKAASSFEKAIEINPNEAYAYNNLGLVYRRQRAYEKAIESFKKQIEVHPDDEYAHSNLGQLYVFLGRYREAAPELETAALITPKSANAQLYLGRAYLKLSDIENATKAFDKAIDMDPTPKMQNDVAYELSDSKVQLDHAESLAQAAVSSVGSELRNISIDGIRASDISNVISLAHFWDTLGWIRFQRGDLAAAEKYLSAAWSMGDDGVIGDHLAQVYEKENRKSDAIKTYELALAAASPPFEMRKRLETLLGDDKQIDVAVNRMRGELAQRRTSKLKRVLLQSVTAEFWVLLSSGSKLPEVRFISGGEKLKSFANDIQSISFATPFPNDDDTRIIRRGILSCSAVTRECQFVLIPVELVRSVN
jgi:tetratricopeptide (TPR) repeat protein